MTQFVQVWFDTREQMLSHLNNFRPKSWQVINNNVIIMEVEMKDV